MKLSIRRILCYYDFFDDKTPIVSDEILKGVNLEKFLIFVCYVNYNLKPKYQVGLNLDTEYQEKILKMIFGEYPDLYLKYNSIYQKHIKSNKDTLIFNRAANLIIVENLIRNQKDFENFDKIRTRDEADKIFQYYLYINTLITQTNIKDLSGTLSLEFLNLEVLALNELFIESDPIYTPYRGYKLIEYLNNKSEYKEEINDYIKQISDSDYAGYIINILNLYIGNDNNDDESDFDFKYRFRQQKIPILLEHLCQRKYINDIDFKILNIKKSPFYKLRDGEYILIDNITLLEKAYNYLINDFWFDYLKKYNENKPKYKFKSYKSTIGYFFENYINDLIKESFHFLKHPAPLTFNQLLFDGIEISDIYIRQNKKILIGQVKSNTIYDKEKFSHDLNTFYKNNKDDFFKNLGVYQLISSLEQLLVKYKEFDNKFNPNKRYTVYPAIIFNDKALQTPLMAQIFNEYFNNILPPNKFNNFTIKPISLIHVSDLERLELDLADKNISIWDILNRHTSNQIIPPFYNTLGSFAIRYRYKYKVQQQYKELIEKNEDNV